MALVDDVVESLSSRHAPEHALSLDDIAGAIGTRAASFEEVEGIVDRLEALGFRVGEPPSPAEVERMVRVVREARALAAALGRRPTLQELSSACGLGAHAVLRALEAARRASR